MAYVYFGEAAGARILRYGLGYNQVGDSYALDVETHPMRPGGSVGDVVFRTIDLLLRHTLGYAVEVTPIVDGVDRVPQTFGGGAPAGGVQETTEEIHAYVAVRGNNVAARIRTLSLPGETEIVDVLSSHSVIRATP
jgi:hypothetical protein